jgi:hypothetical protein
MIDGDKYKAEYPVEEMSVGIRMLCAQAVAVQDACNLSGVVFDFAKAMQVICDESNRLNKGTDWKNRHPVAVLFSSKIASLTHSEGGLEFGYAYDVCKKVIGE